MIPTSCENTQRAIGLGREVPVYCEYKQVVEELNGAKEMLEERLDDEMLELVKTEIDELIERKESLEEHIPSYSSPKTPTMKKT